MKKPILIIISALLICTIVNAQYRINKTTYDYHDYRHQAGDRYSPTVAGVTSFFLPGLGQMLSGEGGRGLCFLGGYLGFGTVYCVGIVRAFDGGGGAAGLLYTGMAGLIVVDIWSIVDAIRVAKVNNLAFRDKNRTSLNLKIRPYINRTDYLMTSKLTTGISLTFTF